MLRSVACLAGISAIAGGCGPAVTIDRLPLPAGTQAVLLILVQNGVKAVFAGAPGDLGPQRFSLDPKDDDGSPLEVAALLYRRSLAALELNPGPVPFATDTTTAATTPLPTADSSEQALLTRGVPGQWGPVVDPEIASLRLRRIPAACRRWSIGTTLSSTVGGGIVDFLRDPRGLQPAEGLLVLGTAVGNSYQSVSLSGFASQRPPSMPVLPGRLQAATEAVDGALWLIGTVLPDPGASPPYDRPFQALVSGRFDTGFTEVAEPTPPEVLVDPLRWMIAGSAADPAIYAMTDNGTILRYETRFEVLRRAVNLTGRGLGALIWSAPREVFAIFPYDSGQASASLIHLSPAGEVIADTSAEFGPTLTLLESATLGGPLAGTTLGRTLRFDPATETWPALPDSTAGPIIALVEIGPEVLALTDDGTVEGLEQRTLLGACPAAMRTTLPARLSEVKMIPFGDGVAVAGYNPQGELTVLFMNPS